MSDPTVPPVDDLPRFHEFFVPALQVLETADSKRNGFVSSNL
jgi:hypothetical protein